MIYQLIMFVANEQASEVNNIYNMRIQDFLNIAEYKIMRIQIENKKQKVK